MTYDELMKTLKICSVGNSTDCDACPLHSSHDCHTIMARNALAELEKEEKALIMQEKKMSELAKKYDPIEIVRTVLDKGGYSVTVTPDGEVRLYPWQENAHWVKEEDRERHYHCSNCGFVTGPAFVQMQYCPHCGRYMDNLDELTSGCGQAFSPDSNCEHKCIETTLELPLVAKFLDNYIRRVEFNVPRMDDTFMKGGWEKVLRKAVEDGEFDDLGDE